MKFHIFVDGMTNKMFGIWNESCSDIKNSNNALVLRINGNGTEKFIDRENEIESWVALEKVKAAPKLHCLFENGLCMDFVKGKTLTVETIKSEQISTKIAGLMANCHSLKSDEVPEGNDQAGCWRFVDQFLMNAKTFPKNFSKHFLTSFAQQFKRDVEMKCRVNQKLSFCHNDLLVGNILWDDVEQKVSFIDYEYAGWNYAAFDVANHFCEYTGLDVLDYETNYPKKVERKLFCEKYLTERNGTDVSADDVIDFMDDVQVMTIASHLAWGAWALVQADISDIDYDFMEYAGIRFDEMVKSAKEMFNFHETI